MNSNSDDYSDSDDELREAFAKGIIKPGLNVELDTEKSFANNIPGILAKYDEIKMELPWVDRMDMLNDLAPLAPELLIQLEKHEQKRANMFAGNAKLKYIQPEQDPVLNDFKREMLFHRQAQSAVLEGMKQLHSLGIKTKRPDDYFAEMAKTDEHMQKIRKNLIAKQEGQLKSEKVKQIREQRKMGKKLQQQARLRKEMDKKETLDKIKKFRKGKLKNLDFLDDDKQNSSRANRNKKYGFGGKKRGTKRNDKKSSMGVNNTKGQSKGGANKRLGKSRRIKARGKKK